MDIRAFISSVDTPLWVIIIGSILFGSILAKVSLSLVSVIKLFSAPSYVKLIRNSLSRPLYFFFPLLLLTVSMGFYIDGHPDSAIPFNFLKSLLIIASAVVLSRIVSIIERITIINLEIDPAASVAHRKLFTRIQFIRRLFVMSIGVVALALILLSFEKGRQFGVGLLTSAGILSVILGFAAQKSLGNLLASLQVAFTQPIKIGDTVVVEKEVGNIEEINITYVVVRLWDRRRLILPITYFIDTPFENWTRNDNSLIAVVYLYLDYRTPLEALRQKHRELVKQHPNWDGEVCELHVTDTQAQQIVVRATMSVSSPLESFALRSYVREQLIVWLRDNHPESLPGMRVIQ